MTFPVLETKRLNLVEIEAEHAPKLYEIFSKEEVIRYYGMAPFKSTEEAEGLVKSFGSQFSTKKAMRWGMIIKDTGEFIGTLGLNNLQIWGRRAEVGFEAHPDFWKKGYTSEAIREVLRYAFTELDLYRIGAVTFPANTASTTLLKKLGFKKEGELRGYLKQNGEFHDALIFSFLQPEWAEE